MRNWSNMLVAIGLTTCSLVPAAAQTRGAVFDWVAYEDSDPSDAAYPVTDGQYRSVVLPGSHPDPSIVRVGDDYYLVNSTFAYVPGLPVYHSRDLVHWTQIGDAVDRADQLNFSGLGIARGAFAPTIRWHDGLFYILNTCIDCGGNYMMTARDAAGPWSDPVWLPGVDGIDPDIFFDDDGKVYITNNAEPAYPALYEGHRAIWIQQIDLATHKMTGPRKMIVDGGVDLATKPIWAEGPHIFKKDGFYYLLTAEGGTAGDHAVTIYRAKSVLGPYTPGPVNPILTQRDLDPQRTHPTYATGHADLVQVPDGSYWAVFLGTRPYRDNLSNMGRETFLLPVTWPEGGWPSILPQGREVPHVLPVPPLAQQAPEGDPHRWRADFDGSELGLGWFSLRGSPDAFISLAAHPGTLTITPRADALGGLDRPAFIGWRQRQQDARFEAALDPVDLAAGESAGVAAFADEQHFVFVRLIKGAHGNRLVTGRRNGTDDPADGRVIGEADVPPGPVTLRVELAGPQVRFAYRADQGEWTKLGEPIDADDLASERSNMFTGVLLGLFAQKPAEDAAAPDAPPAESHR